MNNDDKFNNIMSTFSGIYKIIVSIIFVATCIWFGTLLKGISILIMIPFYICGCAILIISIFEMLPLKNYLLKEKILNICSKIYVLSFFSYWFGFLIVFDYLAIQQKGYSMVLFSIVFWIVGLFMMIKKLKNK